MLVHRKKCKDCRGTGETGANPNGIMLSDPPYPCPTCNGTGEARG